MINKSEIKRRGLNLCSFCIQVDFFFFLLLADLLYFFRFFVNFDICQILFSVSLLLLRLLSFSFSFFFFFLLFLLSNPFFLLTRFLPTPSSFSPTHLLPISSPFIFLISLFLSFTRSYLSPFYAIPLPPYLSFLSFSFPSLSCTLLPLCPPPYYSLPLILPIFPSNQHPLPLLPIPPPPQSDM